MKEDVLPRMIVTCILLAFLSQSQSVLGMQRTAYPPSEFAARRQALMKQYPDGLIVFFGEVSAPPGAHFQQDNDFFYFTGVEDPYAILVMVPRSGDSLLFLPQQAPREEVMEGPNLLKNSDAAKKAGFSAIHPLPYLDEYISRSADSQGGTLRVRLSPRDTIDGARYESDLFFARRSRSPYNDQLPLDFYRISRLRERYPRLTLSDIAPQIDAMRVIKSAAEIDALRRNGAASAEGVRQAMLATRSGAFEYELEAAAMGIVLARGAKSAAYAPIVGSGPNTCIQHYARNSRQMSNGELVLMDFGGYLDHMAMDITRTWPVSGIFTAEQRTVYQTVLEVEKACIEAYRPGATVDDVRNHVKQALEKKGMDPMGLSGGFGHFLGMATHDVGPRIRELKEGMVFAIEPALYFPEKNIGIRIEDTVLITKDGCEVLTKGVPKEIADIEALMSIRRK